MKVENGRPSKALILIVMLLGVCAALQLGVPAAAGQDINHLPPNIAADLARSPKPPPSNEVVGIDIDRFIGHPLASQTHVIDDAILERSILRRGDPYHPGDDGAVLEYWKTLSAATVLGNAATPESKSTDEQVWYVESGKGRLDNGQGYWDLREGIGVLIPPNTRYHLENTTDEPLHMVTLRFTRDKNAAPRPGILVRDVHTLPLPAQGSHWNYFGTNLFTPRDGLNPEEVMAVIYMPPMTIAEPHAHIPHQDEIWLKLEPYSAYLLLGSEVREMPPDTAFLSPPNAQTVHSVINLRKTDGQKWLYLAHWVWDLGNLPELPSVEAKPLTDSH